MTAVSFVPAIFLGEVNWIQGQDRLAQKVKDNFDCFLSKGIKKALRQKEEACRIVAWGQSKRNQYA